MIDEEKQTIFIQLMTRFAQTYGIIDIMNPIDLPHLHPLLQDEREEDLLSLLYAKSGEGYEIRNHYLVSPRYQDNLRADLSLYEYPSMFPLSSDSVQDGPTQQALDLYRYCVSKSNKEIKSEIFYTQLSTLINHTHPEHVASLLPTVLDLFEIEKDEKVVSLFHQYCLAQPSWLCGGKSQGERVSHLWQESCVAKGELTLDTIDKVVKFANAAVVVYGFISIKDAYRIYKGYATTPPVRRDLFTQILLHEEIDGLIQADVLISEKLYTPDLCDDLSEEEHQELCRELSRDFEGPIDVNALKYYLLSQKVKALHISYTVLPEKDFYNYARYGASVLSTPSFHLFEQKIASISSLSIPSLVLAQKLAPFTNLIDADLLLKKILEEAEDDEEEKEESATEDIYAKYMYDEEGEVSLDADESAMIEDFFIQIYHELHFDRIEDVSLQSSLMKLIPFILAEVPSWLYKGQSAMDKVHQIMSGNFDFYE